MRAFAALSSALWRYAEGRRWMLVTYVTLFLIANAIVLMETYAIGRVLDNIQRAAALPSPLQSIFFWLAVMAGLGTGFWLFHGPARVIEQNMAFHVRTKFVDQLYSIITGLPMQWHKNNHSGQTINRIRKASHALHDFSSNSFQLIEMMMKLAGSVIALFIIMPAAAGIAIGVSFVSLSVVFLYDRVLIKRYSEINEREHFTAAALHDYITNILTVITLRLEKLTRSEVWRRLTVYFPFAARTVALEESKWFIKTVIINVMIVSVLGWYFFTTLDAGALPLAGIFFMLYDYLQKIASAFYTFAWKYSSTMHQYADLKSVNPILSAEAAHPCTDCQLPSDWRQITIENLNFVYEDEERQPHHLKDVNIHLTRGKKIALVGESGSGKSTLMALLRGLQDANHVTVKADGKLLEHGLRDLGSSVTLIPQEPEIFANTIEYNITVDTEQPRGELMEDIEIARFDSVLKRLPHGLKTDIREKGVNLSGGEKQRLALARGIFAGKQSDLILLDEPTSSVDSGNERAIYENLWRRFPEKTIISSVHRLHLLPMFDEIYVLEEGKLTEHGSFDELLSKGGLLARMWETYNKDSQSAA